MRLVHYHPNEDFTVTAVAMTIIALGLYWLLFGPIQEVLNNLLVEIYRWESSFY